LTRRALSRLRPLAATFALAGCSQLLDIQDAHVDPGLTQGNAGKAGASSSTDAGRGGDGQGGTSLSPAGGTTSGGRGGSGGDAGSDDDGGAPPATGGTGTAGSGQAGSGGGAGKGGSDAGGKGGKGGTAGTGNTTGEAGGGNEPELTLCERYCDSVMTNCKARYEQYLDFPACISVCLAMTPGTPGDRDVDTVECRLRQADFAESEPFVYCASAGPLGAGECGSNCATYCNLIQSTCTPETTEVNTERSYFDSTEQCLSECTALVADDNTPDQYTTSASVDPVCFMGNHVYCRMYHVTSAIIEGAPDEHCPHAMGAAPCAD
jgi:hypothetical protein